MDSRDPLDLLLTRVFGREVRGEPVPPAERRTIDRKLFKVGPDRKPIIHTERVNIRSTAPIREEDQAANQIIQLLPRVCPSAVADLVQVSDLDRRALDLWRSRWNLMGGFIQPLLYLWATKVWYHAKAGTGRSPETIRPRQESFDLDVAAELDALDARQPDESDLLAPIAWRDGESVQRFVARAKEHARARQTKLGVTRARPRAQLPLHCEWLLLYQVERWTYRRIAERYSGAQRGGRRRPLLDEDHVKRQVRRIAQLLQIPLRSRRSPRQS